MTIGLAVLILFVGLELTFSVARLVALSAYIGYCLACGTLTMQMVIKQVALLLQRDRATCLSVEILQLQNIAIVWHYLCDPTFSRFYTIPKCDRHTHTDGRTDTRRRHLLCLA